MINLQIRAARYFLGLLPSEEIHATAMRALESGSASDVVLHLAIQPWPITMSDVAPLFLAGSPKNPPRCPPPSAQPVYMPVISQARSWPVLLPQSMARQILALGVSGNAFERLNDLRAYVSEYVDFLEAPQIAYYGEVECGHIQAKAEKRIVETARTLLTTTLVIASAEVVNLDLANFYC
jgi:hypothetical protein